VLGVFDAAGGLRVLKDSLDLGIKAGTIRLGCRDCNHAIILSLPLAANTMEALGEVSAAVTRAG
jgi:hypothetical protein